MKKIAFLVIIFFIQSVSTPNMAQPNPPHPNRPWPIDLSVALVSLAKKNQPTDSLLAQIAALTPGDLSVALTNDAQKLVFWINLYNGFTRIALLAQPEDYQKRNRFFSRRRWQVAGESLSLNDIEHGILRKNQYKFGLGYLPQLFPQRFNKAQALSQRDYRIHFALNCGARSCPPVLAYQPATVSQQLDLATKNYLAMEVYRDSSQQKVYVPKLLSWFKGDFGGKKGIEDLLQKNAAPFEKGDRIRFKNYDWTLAL
ncbi:MAG: DUF547 domain-containing protein [Sphingobacteriia bacterium]|nr:MAG: DUF547 domain-containing protein [Sphingobacteriia bacterium]